MAFTKDKNFDLKDQDFGEEFVNASREESNLSVSAFWESSDSDSEEDQS